MLKIIKASRTYIYELDPVREPVMVFKETVKVASIHQCRSTGVRTVRYIRTIRLTTGSSALRHVKLKFLNYSFYKQSKYNIKAIIVPYKNIPMGG